MSQAVVVVGAGYAGVAAVKALERAQAGVDITWISADPHHEIKHEIHRIVRSPGLADGLAVPVEAIAGAGTEFRQGRMTAVHPDDRTVELAGGEQVEYDYLVLTVGARTAFYGIPGLEDHALLLERIDDALAIHECIRGIDAPQVVIGGAGLSGVQTAGEVATFAPRADVTVIEALDTVLPKTTPSLQRAVAGELASQGIETRTGAPIVEATESTVVLDGEEEIPYDVLVWTGGIAGRDVEHQDRLDEQRHRLAVDRTLRTNDERIFACGDAAVIEQPDGIAPPSAQAAWQAAPVAADNVLAAIRGETLSEWTFADKGTLVSIGDRAFGQDVIGVPVSTFDGVTAVTLKKLVAARWIKDVASYRRALSLWRSL